MSIVLDTKLDLPLFGRGKVRDTYTLDDILLIIATDRISAFDVVLPCGIPDKGFVLNQLSLFWFEKTRHIVSNHVIKPVDTTDILGPYFQETSRVPEYLVGRSMIVRKAEVIRAECVVRGYLSGSAWEEYKQSGAICGVRQPKGMQESQELPRPLFTPTTKAQMGHDLPLTWGEFVSLLGRDLANDIRAKSLAVYNFAQDYARNRGIIIADTKFEFGLINGTPTLVDEVLTPDSSRFWDMKSYTIGGSQPSFDKQPVRDWLANSGWNKQPPAPLLPADIIEATSRRYREAYYLLTGRNLQHVSS